MTTEEKKRAIEKAYADLAVSSPEVKEIPAFFPTEEPFRHIRAVTCRGPERKGGKTKVFAYIGFPEGASEDAPVPGVVLVHGGDGHAYLPWVKMWNDRGYAAIAMDHTGYFPHEVNAGDCEETKGFSYGLSGIFCEEGYVDAPDNDGMDSSEGEIEEMWMYHAVGQVIIAHNVLRGDKRVDKEKIGIMGISWGGVIASLAIGWDRRFAFAIPVYGSGYLERSRTWMKDHFSGEAVKALWSAADRFGRVDLPVLWLAWNDDHCFSINANTASYADTVRNNRAARLSFLHRMGHSHTKGWSPAESLLFADSVVRGTPALAGFARQPAGRSIRVRLQKDAGTDICGARLFYITEPQTFSRYKKYSLTDTFMDQTWEILPLDYDAAECTVTGTVPAEAAAYYIEVTAEIGGIRAVSCSEFIELTSSSVSG